MAIKKKSKEADNNINVQIKRNINKSTVYYYVNQFFYLNKKILLLKSFFIHKRSVFVVFLWCFWKLKLNNIYLKN